MSEFRDAAARLMALVPEERPVEPADESKAREEALIALQKAGVPKRVRRVLEGPLSPTAALAAIDGFDGGILVLSGRPGCGKTVAAARWLALGTRSIAFVTAFQLERLSRYDDSVTELVRAGRLVLDDAGTEYLDQKGHLVSFLDGLLNARFSEERGTIIATNLNAAEFKQSYGARIADRVHDCGKFVSINEHSLRRKGAP